MSRGAVMVAEVGGRGVDEVDVALLDALHVNPRTSFDRLGTVLGISAVTAARRWKRLAESGRAWVSSVPGPRLALVGAVYEVEAKPGRTEEVGRALAEVPQVGSVYLTDGAFDVHALVFAGDMDRLSSLVFDQLPRVAGVARARARVGLEWFSGVRWRLGAISTGQERSVGDAEAAPDRGPRPRTMSFTDADRALYLALQRDGRARFSDLARELGTAEHLVRRRMNALVRRGVLSFRTDFARGEGGWTAELVLWLRVPPDRLDRVGVAVGEWPETRICLSAVGAQNLMVMAQVHQLTELGGLVERLGRAFPDVVVDDQRVVLRPVKSWGRVLDHVGHATRIVPVDPWAPIGSNSFVE